MGKDLVLVIVAVRSPQYDKTKQEWSKANIRWLEDGGFYTLDCTTPNIFQIKKAIEILRNCQRKIDCKDQRIFEQKLLCELGNGPL